MENISKKPLQCSQLGNPIDSDHICLFVGLLFALTFYQHRLYMAWNGTVTNCQHCMEIASNLIKFTKETPMENCRLYWIAVRAAKARSIVWKRKLDSSWILTFIWLGLVSWLSMGMRSLSNSVTDAARLLYLFIKEKPIKGWPRLHKDRKINGEWILNYRGAKCLFSKYGRVSLWCLPRMLSSLGIGKLGSWATKARLSIFTL